MVENTSNKIEKQAPAPPTAMAGLIAGFVLSQAIHVAAKLDLADRLENNARTPEDLAHEAKCDAKALYRLLRSLASVGVFAEDTDGRFRLTPMADCLRRSSPNSLHAWAMMIGQDWVRRPWSEVLFSVERNAPAFDEVMGTSAYGYLQQHPEAACLFHQAMTKGSELYGGAILASYDFSAIDVLVDVGGGEGALLAELLAAHPGMKGILMELPPVAETARSRLAEQELSDRTTVIAGDFFSTVPQGGDGYLLKWILHNWNDEKARRVLRSCREAMSATAKLLIVERVLPSGNAPSDGKILDLNMLVLQGGAERTETEFRELLAASGFELTRSIETPCPLNILEARPV